MRIRAGLGVMIWSCAALSACAATPKGPDATVTTPAVGRPPPPASAQAALSSEAFTPYASLGIFSNDGLVPGESSFSLAAACITAAGYPSAGYSRVYQSIAGPAGNLAVAIPWGGWGYLGAADAQQYGFRFPLGSALGIVLQPTNQPSLPPAEEAAADKCGTIVQTFSTAADDGPLAVIGTLGNDISSDVVQDPAVKAATRAWTACMAKNGYSADQPFGFDQEQQASLHAPPLSASAQQAQLAAAVADAGCTQSSDLAGIYFAVQASYEQQLVTANQQALAAAASAYRAAYARQLSKLPALMQTAKAQPFRSAAQPARRGRSGR
jgi:hypothetical protein